MLNKMLLLRLIGLLLVVVQVANGFSTKYSNSTRDKRQAKCDGFKCKNSGECLDEDKLCDGRVDCEDGSDETNACNRVRCAGFLFRCAYGACINPDLECDGKKDCRDNSDETTPKCTTQNITQLTPEQISCGPDQFRCNSGQCIYDEGKCDGKPDCDDSSDETLLTCSNVKCPGFTYRCAYGACANGNAECNGIKDCADGSDENPQKCKGTAPAPQPVQPPTIRPPPAPNPAIRDQCILPPYPTNGYWTIYGAEGYTPGLAVKTGTVLLITCKKRHKLDGVPTILCDGNRWNHGIGNCLPLCPNIPSTETMQVTCSFRDKVTNDCTEALSGSVAKFKCALFYEDLQLSRNPVRVCRDGSWDLQVPNCSPVCGVKSVSAQTLIINGTNVVKGDYPWQVGLYSKDRKILFCGGSLINQRVILTAAHCVTDIKGNLKSKDNYIAAVGIYYRTFKDPRDKEAQFSTLQHMFVPEQYKGENQNFLGDIALLVTKETFILSKRVQPVCVDWGLNHEAQFSDPTIKGYVTGWGHTEETGKPSEVLKELKVPYIDYNRCSEDLPPDYENFLTYDKLCAGYMDNGTSVCSGDSGGGLVFKNRYDGRYYLTGIVSLSPRAPTVEGGCNSQQYALYTKVAKYITEFILEKERCYRPGGQCQ